MKQTRYTEAQIVDILAQAARGEMTAVEVCRINGVSEQTFYRWKRRYGDMPVSEVRRLRELEAENARLKRLLAERDLEIRGEGQVMGARQAGVPDLKLARLARDRRSLMKARELAQAILADDPSLSAPVNAPLADAVHAAFGHELAWLLKA